MLTTAAAALTLSFLASRVAGHGAVTSYVIDGKTYAGYQGFSPATGGPTIEWQWPDYNPVLDPSTASSRCNGGTSAQLSAPVPAGGSVTANWAQWTHAQGGVAVWLFKCAGDFSACTGSGAGWFKIDQAGLLSGTEFNGTWGAGEVMDTLKWTTKLPASLAAGNYLIRHELLAVHQANTPQLYPECAQIQVTGSGTALPGSGWLKSIPGYTSLSDTQYNINIYSTAAQTVTTWSPPGGPAWDGKANSQPPTGSPAQPISSAPPPATTQAPPASSPAPPKSTTPPPATTANPPVASGATVAKYGQCGGQGYAGPTVCASGSTCTVSNAFYSQCL